MKARLTRAESRLRARLHGDDLTVATMTDDQLAALITGDVNARAADLTDEMLKAIAGE